MKIFIRSLIALAYLISATSSPAGMLVNPFVFAATGGATISFVSCTEFSIGSVSLIYTSTNHPTGTAAAGRKTIVAVGVQDNATAFTINSMTVGGAGATEKVDNSADTGSLVQGALYMIDNPSGTTATIVATFSEDVERGVICVWAAYALASETPTDIASQFQTASAAITLDLDVSAGGIGVGFSIKADDGPNAADWTGMAEDVQDEIAGGGGNGIEYSGANTTTSGAPFGVTVDWANTNDSVGVSASFL